eukprot:CAMPEP_0119333124 /NCGR_PEP_ID=MMETSP1333-20130426/84394_1 /TAXON_ID=418940 /ORGANISM="Scyphosphaera apsteinii, Strain RCC1455" /LENGTH=216 /DNA_ID=CAMNT_0007343089 /DNA_START=207 /DNA_END=854 /DNA_ORIENTATION=-
MAVSAVLHTTDWTGRLERQINRLTQCSAMLVASAEAAANKQLSKRLAAVQRRLFALEMAAAQVKTGSIYHPGWIRLLDYSAIFVGIALLYSSLGGLIMGDTVIFRRFISPLVWSGAIVGVLSKACFLDTARWVEAAAFLAQGWACLLGYRAIRAALTLNEGLLLLGGGLCFTLGVLAYVIQWPDFHWHRDHFRAHEVFHLGTIGGFSCMHMLMLSL